MSRAYRIRVRESMQRVFRASDHVSTQLEVLEVLPREAMGQLIADELTRRGFRRVGEQLVREAEGVRVTIAPETGEVTVQADAQQTAELEAEGDAWAFDDRRGLAEEAQKHKREELRQELEGQAARRSAALQAAVTDRLEAQLGDLKRELNQAVNRATGEALKRKAAQLGQIREISEDPQAGALTIVVEV